MAPSQPRQASRHGRVLKVPSNRKSRSTAPGNLHSFVLAAPTEERMMKANSLMAGAIPAVLGCGPSRHGSVV